MRHNVINAPLAKLSGKREFSLRTRYKSERKKKFLKCVSKLMEIESNLTRFLSFALSLTLLFSDNLVSRLLIYVVNNFRFLCAMQSETAICREWSVKVYLYLSEWER